RAAAWVATARRAGIPARVALGVAWDGAAFVWHAWAEARAGGAWIPVDPSFGQAPARGPRFTLARHAPGDGAARAEAGRRILACWGRARVERR
ncbi:MAG TPA: transglutaminase-like domain-containing protein, partial [Anaeromyxobacter sp.]